jgi:hypothetical protein
MFTGKNSPNISIFFAVSGILTKQIDDKYLKIAISKKNGLKVRTEYEDKQVKRFRK